MSVTVISEKRRNRLPAKVSSALTMVLLVSACKGGSGTGLSFNYTSPYAPPPPVSGGVLTAPINALFAAVNSQTSVIDAAAAQLLATDNRYLRQKANWYFTNGAGQQVGPTYSSYPLANSGVAFAHAAGITGAGQTVGVVDTILNSGHQVFNGTTFMAVDNSSAASSGTDPDHGTMVSSIIAGDSPTFIGVAPDANLDFATFTDINAMINATYRAINNGYVAQNNSWGYDTQPIGNASFQNVFSGPSGQAYLSALDTYASQGVVVFAVSNQTNAQHATIMDALPYIRPSLEEGWIAVGNATPKFQGGNLTGVIMQSSSCLEAARWCILADGAWDAASGTSSTSYDFGVGSSFATPQVSGALALLGQAFPTLTPHELRVRLLASANNSFFNADGTVELATGFDKRYSFRYGVGFLDVRAALLPIGPTSMSTGNGVQVNANQPVIIAGSAMGDAVSRSLKGIDVAVTDVLDTPFSMHGDALATSVGPQALGISHLYKSLASDMTSDRLGHNGAIDAPFDSFAGQTFAMRDVNGDFGVSLLVPARADDAFGVSVKRALTDGPTRLELGLKLAHDDGSVMGFGKNDYGSGANLASLELGLTQDLGNGGFLNLSGELGLADLGSQVALSNVSSARFNSIKLDIGSRDVFASGDRLSFGASMPMAVTNGSARLSAPVIMAAGRSLSQPIGVDLAPSSRQVDLSINYQREIADGLEMVAELLHSENYGNRAGETQDAAVLALKFSF
ncbi:MAG: S8 family peptidase [Paracoccaceae bacterium]